MANKIQSTRFLEIALIINNVDVNNTQTLKEYHLYAKDRDVGVDNVDTIGEFLRMMCYDNEVDTSPIAHLLSNTSDNNVWLYNLEFQVIPYLISKNVIKKI